MKKVFLKVLKFFKWVGIVLLSLFIILLVTVEILDRYIASEKGAFWVFKNVSQQPKAIKFSKSEVRYVEIGDPNKPALMLIHGDKDTLVPYENSPFVQKLLPESTQMITFPNGDHPLHMQEPQYLVDFVLKN